MDLQFLQVVNAMIAEQGESWLQCEDFENRSEMRNAIVVANAPDYGFKILRVNESWQTHWINLNVDEMAAFFAAFGSHWSVVLNSWVDTSSGLVPIRAFIKNGRKRGGFSISIDVSRTVPKSKAA